MSTDLVDLDVIRSDRRKSGKGLIVGISFVILFAVELYNGWGSFALTLCGLVFFGSLTVLMIAGLLFPPELHVEADGLRLMGLRPWRVAWADIARFRVQRLRRTSVVLIEYRTDQPPRRRFGRSARPQSLPTLLWMRPEELQELLQARLERARSADPTLLTSSTLEAPPTAIAVTVWPWLSFAIIGILAVVFAAEILAPLTPPDASLMPSTATLAGRNGS